MYINENRRHIEDELDIQIISPMRRGEAGSTLISQYVQQAVNPPDSLKGKFALMVLHTV